ncbi:MAG: ABC transporter substrate-binding protein [Rhizobiaceae bacterium]
MALAVGLASCQSISIDDSFKLQNPTSNISKPSGSSETFGSGSVKVSMIVNRTNASGVNATGLAYRNGAALAVKDLGSQSIKLTILDAKGSPERVRSLAQSEIGKKTQLLIVPGDSASVSSVSSLVSNNGPTVIALGATAGQGVYSFLPRAADGLTAGIRYAAAGKKKSVLIIAPQTSASSVLNAVKRGLDNSVTVSGVAPYLGTPSPAQFVRLFSSKLRNTDIVAFSDRTNFVAQIAAELKKSTRYRKITLVGREDWPASLMASPALQGAIIATRDTSGTSLIADRYNATYSQKLSTSAAYGYDLIALASGLVRAKGPTGLSRRQITAPSGFGGTTGLFRFGSRGQAERLYQISKVENGKLKVVQKSPGSF